MPAKRATGRFGPNGLAHTLRNEVSFKGQTEGWLQWGKCVGVHGVLYTSTTLYANASANATTIETHAACQVNDFLMIGGMPQAIKVTAVSGSMAPFTITLSSGLPSGQSSGAAVIALWTVDINLNGTQNMPSPENFVTVGIKFEEGWNPVVGDIIPVIRGPGGLVTDRFVLRELAGHRGPGNSAFVSLVPGSATPPPTNIPWGYGSLYVDPGGDKLYVCITASIQNSSGVVTTPAVWKSCTIS